jgi:hypothetical protein
MTPPDEVRWGAGIQQIYDDMASNVLRYGGLTEGLYDIMTSLPMVWLPGMKGDTESEQAAEEMQAAWENIDERGIAMRAWCVGFERGFSPVENVWGVVTRGVAEDFIAPVALINRPVSWFGFDYLHRPRFKPQYRTWAQDFEVVPDFKVSFLRCGSLHYPGGHGFGQDCYPSVFAIDAAMKGYMQLVERFGFMPVVVTYPNNWRQGGGQYASMKRNLQSQWKNVLMMPGEVDRPTYEAVGGDAFNAANASAEGRLKFVQKLEDWLALRVWGTMPTSGNTQTGSFAREQVSDAARLYKAPSYAACIEATINRGFVRPCMLVNRPNLPETKWPRVAIDASFGSDLDMRLKVYEAAIKWNFKVAATSFAQDFKMQPAKPGDVLLETPKAAPMIGAPEESANPEAATEPTMFGESGIITLHDSEGRTISMFADSLVYTENRGTIRAAQLQAGDVPRYELRRAS